MEFLNFPIVALGAALICLIGVTIYAITQRGSLRSRDEQLVVARAQAYAMLELSQAGVLFLDREHKLMGEASAAAPELLGHTCGAGTAFVQVIADLVDVHRAARNRRVPRIAVEGRALGAGRCHAESARARAFGLAPPGAAVRAPGGRWPRASHHRFDRAHRRAARRAAHHRSAGAQRRHLRQAARRRDRHASRAEGGHRRHARMLAAAPARDRRRDTALPCAASAASAAAPTRPPNLLADAHRRIRARAPRRHRRFDAVVARSSASPAVATLAALAPIKLDPPRRTSDADPEDADAGRSLPTNAPAVDAPATMRRLDEGQHLATTITSPDVAQEAAESAAATPDPDPSGSSIRRIRASTKCSRKSCTSRPPRLEQFLAEAREKAGQLRAIIKLPAREPQAFREKLVLILELIRGIHARAERLPLPSVCERAERFEAALNGLRDKQTLSGNDFLPLAVKLDDLLSHLAIQGEVVSRLREWRVQNGYSVFRRHRRHAAFRHRHGHHDSPAAAARRRRSAITASQPMSATQRPRGSRICRRKASRRWPRSSPTCIPSACRSWSSASRTCRAAIAAPIEKILGQLIHNAIRHGVETPADRAVQDKPEIGTVAVQFARVGADGYQLSVQDDGRGLDHDKIRAEAVRQGVLTRGRRRQHRSAQARRPHLPPRVHHRR